VLKAILLAFVLTATFWPVIESIPASQQIPKSDRRPIADPNSLASVEDEHALDGGPLIEPNG
jgi:hypothetical protein